MRTTKHLMQKRAGLWDRLKDPTTVQAAAALTPVLVAAGTAAMHGVGKLREARERTQDFKSMLELHPELRKERPEEVKRIYSTLQRFGPSFAKDPLVSGAWVQSALENEKTLGQSMGGTKGQGVLLAVRNLVDLQSGAVRGTARDGDVLMRGLQLGGAVGGPARELSAAYKNYKTEVGNADLEAARGEAKLWQDAFQKAVSFRDEPAIRAHTKKHPNVAGPRPSAANVLRRHRP